MQIYGYFWGSVRILRSSVELLDDKIWIFLRLLGSYCYQITLCCQFLILSPDASPGSTAEQCLNCCCQQWGICCQEWPLWMTLLATEVLCSLHVNWSFRVWCFPLLLVQMSLKINSECNLQLELVLTQEGNAVSCVVPFLSFCSREFHLKHLWGRAPLLKSKIFSRSQL